MIRVATCVPRQHHDRGAKLEWLDKAVRNAGVDLFCTPQEYFGGHVAMPDDMHIEREWIDEHVGAIARETSTAIAVGAAVKHASGGATEDYLYYGPDGTFRGHHRKFALPSYDDVRSKGAGRLWPEVSYAARVRPVEIAELRLKMGTVFCWEVFSLSLFGAYSFAGVNLVTHPIKFAPRGWLKLRKPKDDANGVRSVIGFDQDPKSSQWIEKLKYSQKYEAFCPVAVSCNTWDLGAKYAALVGHVDEVRGSTVLHELPSTTDTDYVHTFEFNPMWYTAFDSAHSMGAFKEVAGEIADFQRVKAWTMSIKVRRLEAQLIGGTTKLDCALMAATQRQQKKSTKARARKSLARGA